MVELSSKQKGNLTELKCITAFYELGYQCSIPYGENSRYDLIADIDGRLIRVQRKTSHEVEPGAIEFKCRNKETHCEEEKENNVVEEEEKIHHENEGVVSTEEKGTENRAL